MTDRELMQQALEAMGTVGADWICEASHHAKKDQHKWGEPCPLQQRWHIAYQAVRERLEQPEQEPVAWMIWTQGPVSTFLKKYEAESEFDRLNRQYPEPSRKLIALYTAPQRKPLTDDLYNELLFAVGNKYPNETRHQTALRYILQAEKGDEKGDEKAAIRAKGQG